MHPIIERKHQSSNHSAVLKMKRTERKRKREKREERHLAFYEKLNCIVNRYRIHRRGLIYNNIVILATSRQHIKTCFVQ